MAAKAVTIEPRPHGRTDVVGRSAATGKLVLKPASKPGKVTDAQAREVVREVIRMRASNPEKLPA